MALRLVKDSFGRLLGRKAPRHPRNIADHANAGREPPGLAEGIGQHPVHAVSR